MSRLRTNVFVIPSWYPSARNPLSGSFIREQVAALSVYGQEFHPIVSNWGFDDGMLPVSSPRLAIDALRWRIRNWAPCLRKVDGVCEAFRPLLMLSSRLIGQRLWLDILVRANRKNFSMARDRYGPIALIHAHVSFPAGYVAKKVAEHFNVPYVVTEHMGPFPFESMLDEHGRPQVEISEALCSAARCIAVSPALANRMVSLGFSRPDVIPNLVNENLFFPAAGIGRPPFVFLTVCSITKAKGVETLIRAIANLNPDPNSIEFHIVGNGPQMNAYQTLAEELGVGDKIRWLGEVSRERIPDMYRSCHAFVLPSEFETFGLVFAEAIASGKPVIATRCGGPESIVTPDNGFLVDVGDEKGLADAMRTMVRDYDRFFAEAIRLDFLSRFSRGAVVGQITSIYRQVLRNAKNA